VDRMLDRYLAHLTAASDWSFEPSRIRTVLRTHPHPSG
jgi:hypothetical protein